MKKATFFVLVALAAVSCKEEIKIDYSIHNATSEPIRVQGQDHIQNEKFDLEIAADQEAVITTYQDKDKEVEEFKPADILGKVMIVTNVSGDTMTSDYQNIDFWSRSSTKDGDDAEVYYRTTIKESDFQ